MAACTVLFRQSRAGGNPGMTRSRVAALLVSFIFNQTGRLWLTALPSVYLSLPSDVRLPTSVL
jgi:hypothetical protein